MKPDRVVVDNIIEDFDLSCLSGRKSARVQPFGLKAPEKAFSRGIVPAIALAAHARHHMAGPEQFLIIMARILASAIRMM